MVTLDIDQEVTSIQDEVTRGIDSPRFTTRKAVTSLVVENGRTIVIGGIIETKYVNVVGKIPVLHLIPLLGNLFKSQDISKKKTELLLVLTPYVVSNSNEADKITQDFERKLKAIGKLRSKKTTNKNVSVQ
jgi:general secretion pathway protein D